MNITFRQLRLFLALQEHGSITAAAKASHVTQPTVSMQLKEMTDAIGVPLYEVVGKQLFLTQAGEELARTAHTMVGAWGDFEQRVNALKGVTRGQLRVAVVSTAKYFIPRILGAFCKAHPDIDIALEVQNRDGVVQRLRDNRDDVYIMSTPPADIDIDSHSFMPNPLVVVAPASHPLAAKKRIQLAVLQDQRFILREKGSGTRLACDAHFAKHGFTPTVRLELGSNEAIKQAVAGELGLTVLSTHALGEHLVDDSLVVLKVAGFPIHSHWFVVTRKGKRVSPVAHAFMHYLDTLKRPAAQKSTG
jgi:DNA-binding transcriptional LysR family regulator